MSENVYISSQHFCFSKYYQWTQPEGGRKEESLCQHLQTCLKKFALKG